jgi:diguanylate cyclase (GGDEF)-like protein
MHPLMRALRLEGWSVSARLRLINGLLIIALVVVGAIAWQALGAQSRAMSNLALISKAARFHQDADTVHANLRADINALLAGGLSNDDRSKLTDSLTDEAKTLRADLVTLERLNLAPDLVETEIKVHNLADAYMTLAMDVGHLAARDVNAAEAFMTQFREAGDALDEAITRQTGAFSAHINQANEDAAEAETVAKRWLILAGILTIVGVGMLVDWYSRSIRRSLKSVRDVAVALSKGDLTVRSARPGTDELGQLAQAIDVMADNLKEVIGRLRSDADRDAFGTQLVEALEMADTEAETYDVLARAMTIIGPNLPTELLLADSSRAHLERATQHPQAGSPGCKVESPFSCMAVRRGNPVVFADSEALNACSRLRARPSGSISAVCVPVSFMGRALGVLHATGQVGNAPDAKQVMQLTTLGIQAGSRIGTVRAFNTTQRQASTDSLTGLPNRRTAEDRVRDLTSSNTPFALVIGDLDHFKRLNDSRGHEAGDQALRLFADSLRQSLREGDLPVRWGGEEFVMVLPRSTAVQALEVVDRLRANLATALLASGTAAFTASFGIADTSMSPGFEQLLRIADEALYQAKENGRDRAVIGPGQNANTTDTRRAVEHPASVDTVMLANAGEKPSFGSRTG